MPRGGHFHVQVILREASVILSEAKDLYAGFLRRFTPQDDRVPRKVRGAVFALILPAALASSCGKEAPRPPAETAIRLDSAPAQDPYPISDRGGTPTTGPEERYNRCERIWCLTHRENFFLDHFLQEHVGWILHDDGHGDVFVPRWRKSGPEFPWAGRSMLQLCGRHAHPHVLGRPGGPVKSGGFSRSLGLDRAHYNAYGTRLDPCCVNPIGWSFIHSTAGLMFRFPTREEMAELPAQGWQKPFPARTAVEPPRPG